MTLILSGTDGLSDVDGSAATPAIRGTDANTGIFFPAADTIAFSEGGVESMRIDSSGNVGIGTSSPTQKLEVSGSGGVSLRVTSTNSSAQLILNSAGTNIGYVNYNISGAGALAFYDSNAATERMRIDSSGNVGIGTSSPNSKLNVAGAGTAARIEVSNTSDSLRGGYIRDTGSAFEIGTNSGVRPLAFAVDGTERGRFDLSGVFLIGKTTASASGNGFYCDAAGSSISTIASSNTYHVYSSANSTYRFYVNVNGGISNFSANNVNLSDERVKKNIELSGSYLAKICAIPVKLFNYKDEAEGEQRTLGVIAQDVEAVAPELVNNDGWVGEEPEDGVPLKTIYQTDLQYALMKCIQEQQAIITQLQADVAALKGTP